MKTPNNTVMNLPLHTHLYQVHQMMKTLKYLITLVLFSQIIACKTIKLNDTPIIDGTDTNNGVKTVNLTNGDDILIPNKEGIVTLNEISDTVTDLETLKKQELEKLEALKNLKNKNNSVVDLSQFKIKSVYFDFDNFSIRQSDEDSIKEHAGFLQKNAQYKLNLQGHTDERGGREYNLALGQKRAEAVRQFLAIMGVSDEQLEAISFGEEKPAGKLHNETSWQENRRVDFYYE